MIKLRKVKVIGNSIEAFYENDDGKYVEVQGEIAITFFKGDKPEFELVSLERFESHCKHCEITDWEPVDVTTIDTYQLEGDVMNQIDIDEVREFGI